MRWKVVVAGVLLVVGVCAGATLAGVFGLDWDGMSPVEEYKAGTDPLTGDTDHDGLDDDWEIYDNGTDPVDNDTDGDGLEDGEEIHDLGTDPLDPDTDSDGLSDRVEVRKYGSDPTAADSDSDGLDDWAEVHDHGTDPAASDTDDDGLSDPAELTEYDTNATVADTDGDGLPDGPELKATDKLPGADPLRMDVYVEIDYMPSTNLSAAERHRLIEAFDEAPITNPSGEDGIALHLFFDEEVPHSDPVYWDDGVDGRVLDEMTDYRKRFFDNASMGYHYAVLTDDIIHRTEGTTYGVAQPGSLMVFDQGSPLHDGRLFMHEFGHSLGLTGAVHDGIDTDHYLFSEYPSVMNYNGVQKGYTYSNGTNSEHDFDDWGYLADNIYTPPTDDLRNQTEK